MSFPP
ncbi:hypothetical protein AAFC00_002120, partial [Neodothiora populina]